MKTLLLPVITLLLATLPMAADQSIMDWRFNEDPAPDVQMTDSSGQARGHLVKGKNPEGLPKLITQDVPCGSAWDFAGSDCVLIVQPEGEVANLGNPTSSKGMAFAFWVKFDNSDGSADHLRFFGWRPVIECVAMKDGLSFLTPSVAQGDGNTILSERVASAPGVLDGHWHHVVLNADFSPADSKVTVFVDGMEVESASAVFPLEAWEARASVFTIANRWPGLIGRFQAWNRPLETGEIGAIFHGKDDR